MTLYWVSHGCAIIEAQWIILMINYGSCSDWAQSLCILTLYCWGRGVALVCNRHLTFQITLTVIWQLWSQKGVSWLNNHGFNCLFLQHNMQN